MAEIKLDRTGEMPLAFEGELLASASSSIVAGQERNRWHEVAVYRTAGGAYVASIGYRTQWQGEQAGDSVAVLHGPEEVAEYLRMGDPASLVVGFPTGDRYADKQVRLIDQVERDYAALCSEVLGACGDEFVERVA